MSYSDNAISVYKKLYFTKDETNPLQTHDRVANAIADTPEFKQEIIQALDEKAIRPNSPVFMNAGSTTPQFSACFVGDLQDSLDSILKTNLEAGKIYSNGSGLGINYGYLREKGAELSTNGESSGACSFMYMFASTAECVKSGGKTRRAAHNALLTDNHPDIEEFITIKNGTDQRLRSMNLNIATTDKFMQAVKDDKDWNLIGVKDKQIKKTLKARELYDKIIDNIHKNAEPNFSWVDRANEDNCFYPDIPIVAANPCQEEYLLPYTSCNLIHINLNNCATHNEFDFNKLKYYTRLCTRFADNVVDLSMYPTDDYKQASLKYRPIGVGLMSLADVLIKLDYPYDSPEGIKLAGEIMRNITKESIIMSSELAIEKGVFPLYEQYKDNLLRIASKFFNFNNPKEKEEFEKVYANGLRNSQWTTIAPTGSCSISADCSAGSEPLFAICYEKHISDSNDIWYFVNPEFEKRYKNQSWYNDALKQISKEKGSCQNLPYLDKHEKRVFVTAHDIHWKSRLDMQEALQKGCSNSLSVTINLPKETSKETISQIYMEAWEKRLKGLTIFVDGCLSEQPITFGKSDSKEETKNECFIPEMYKKDLLDLERAERHRCKWRNSNLYINVSLDDDDNPIEIFTKLPKEAGINGDGLFNPTVYMERQSNWDLISRLVSLALRYNIPLDDIVKQCDKSKISLVDAAGIISRVLKAYIKDDIDESDDSEQLGSLCPDCGQYGLIAEGGCLHCLLCNFSKCS